MPPDYASPDPTPERIPELLPVAGPLDPEPATPRRSYRWLWFTLAALGLLILAGATFVILHKTTPPRVVRLLPESDAVVYVNLAAIREATHFDRQPVTPDPEYRDFIAATGIHFEHDLEEAAFAINRLSDPLTTQGPVGYSEVFRGSFDVPRLTAWLKSQSAATESYAGHTIYSVPHEGRTVRIVLLGSRLVAASNMPTAEQLHAILDHDASFYPRGPSILQDHFRDVPVFSFAWGLAQIEAPLTGDGNVHVFGFRIPLPTNTVFIGSVRYLNALQLRIEEIAPDETVASISVGVVRTILTFYAGEQRLTSSLGGTTDPQTAALLQSIQITQNKDRAVLTANVPLELLRRIFTPEKK
jgi:hypothetical protein